MIKTTVLLLAHLLAASAGARIIVTVAPENEGQSFGTELAWLGDVNADGWDDFLVMDEDQVGAGYEGRAYVYFGGPGLDDQPDLVLQQDDTGMLREALEGPFDFNCDGYGDIAISSPYYDPDGAVNAGAVFIYYGGPGLDAVADHVIPGPWTKYYFGTGLANAGKFTEDDSCDDLAATIYTSFGWGPPPTVYVYPGGANPGIESVWGRSRGTDYSGFGRALEFAGDMNGDGAGDIVMGEPWRDGYFWDGSTMVVQQSVGGVIAIHGGSYMWHAGYQYQPVVIGEAHLGYAVAGGFDFDADGLDDVLGAAPNIRASHLVFGNPDVWSGSGAALVAGHDVAGLGDVNGDGYDDIAVADLTHTVWLFWGGPDYDLVPDQAIRPEPGQAWDHLHIGRAGDLDGDGLADILVHFRQYVSGQPHLDRVRVYAGSPVASGVPDLPRGVPALAFLGNAPNPFNPRTDIRFRTEVATEVVVRIFDVRGRLLRSLAPRSVLAGEHAVTWNGRDDAGRSAPSGLYHVQVSGSGVAVGGSVMLVR